MVNILNECSFIKPDGIKKVEEKYKAKYVFESCLKLKDGGWCNRPVAIFYTETPHPEGSNYFGLYFNDFGDLMITNGISATEPFEGLQVGENVIYSRYRHDYREYKDVAVDGGRDYLKVVGNIHHPHVKIKVVEDHLEVMND